MYTLLNITSETLHCGNIGHAVTDFELACQLAHQFGFESVNIDPSDHHLTVDEKKNLLEKYHLKAAAAPSPLKMYENHTEKEFHESLIEFTKQAAEIQALGCKIVLCYLPPFANQLNFYQNFRQFSSRLSLIKPILESYHLKLALEFIGPTETRQNTPYDFVHTIDGTRALIASAGLDQLAGFKLDVHHWANSGAGILDIKHLSADEILYVELNDGQKGFDIFNMPEFHREIPLSTGVTDIKGFIDELKKKNYQGPICVEPWNEAIKKMPLENSIELIKKSLDACID